MCYEKLGQLDEAEADLGLYVKTRTDDISKATARFRRGNFYRRHGRLDESKQDKLRGIEHLENALSNPLAANANAVCRNNLAWYIATDPDLRDRDFHRAVSLAQEAVKLDPLSASYLITLGVCLYRAGHWQEAIEPLEKHRRLDVSNDAFDYFFEAMAYWQLGNKTAANKRYKSAIERVEDYKANGTRPYSFFELDRFRAEAAALLGIDPAAKAEELPQ